ncbi:MAG: undecaprenyldiphospho-muramoylpentapeptide beta-N-acetylglucosaminyltransferase [Treponema sp.]|jgi:UDP-N-acetylglucosamine--N-acetylmuramyl-(pentapeptide) pyrophosphoryl-undecaprenol N-acetylglucosamine transferase|nr:undecaprenyldiphospho-muramoylpentapeptide beta-N-acetylglucosaminyltransferase [Treponema sp.]
MIHIAFTGGGTGGHIYPGLAVAAALQKLVPCRIFWIGSDTGMDRSLVSQGGLEFFGIPAGKFRRYFSLKNLSDILKIGAGFLAARRILKREKPVLLFSKGGFVSVPPCAAAASLRIPVFTHESDYSPGLATRINIRFAPQILTAYEDTASFFPERFRNRVHALGNPIRPEFRSADAAAGRAFLGIDAEDRVLLVLGGSQGAREINRLIREALPALTRHYVVVHQTGPHTEWDLPPQGRYRPYPYIREELSHVLAAAELVLGRSGAGTLWECAALGKPMVLIPLAGSGTRGDQVENARYFEKAGAAVVLRGGAGAEALEKEIASLSENESLRASMAAASARIGAGDSADRIARLMVEYLKDKS